MNYPVYDLNIDSLIKNYFNLYFNQKFIQSKYLSDKKRHMSLNKIFVSKAEIKHTNSKVVITIYVYNRERTILYKKLIQFKKRLVILKKSWNKLSTQFLFFPLQKNNHSLGMLWNFANLRIEQLSFSNVDLLFFNKLTRFLKRLRKIILNIRKYKLRFVLNRSKFEDIFLYKLGQLISRYYGKKVEFNIVNLKSVTYNADIFTNILVSKLKDDRANPLSKIKTLFGKVVLPSVNNIKERGRVEKTVDFSLLQNKYKSLNISSLINTDNDAKDNFNEFLNNLHSKAFFEQDIEKASYLKIRNVLLNNIKYKNMGGVKFKVKGRLTRRYRADRAICKSNSKGGLKNIDSAFKGLSSVVFKGYQDSNTQKSLINSKRRIGSFAVSGWFGGQ